MNRIKKLGTVILSVLTVAGTCVVGSSVSVGASGGTGAGLAEWALNAYYSGWSYSWGGATPGAVDCSGLIYSYCGGNRTSMLSDAQANGRDWGYVSNGIPRVHGLGLSRPGHVGVYIEDGMEVDARGDDYGVCYQEIGGWNGWDCWFKLTAVTYPTTGWEEFNGNYYYYENGEYIVNTSRTIGGDTYYFDAKGHSSTTPSDTSSTASSGTSSSSSGSTSGQTQSKPSSWKKGSVDDEVAKIQQRLAELGYYNGAIDGVFGDDTDAAFRAFQEAAGLYVDGIAGSDRELLYSDDAPYAPTEAERETSEEATFEESEAEEATEPTTVLPQNGDFSNEVAEVQSKLAELGYFGIEATGFFGDYTAEAIMSFQLANGLEATGELDEATYALLFSEDAIAYVAPETDPESEQSGEAASTAVNAIASSQSVVAGMSNQMYANTASKAVEKANKVTEKALEKSSAIVPDAKTAQVKRTANIWLWMVLVAVVLGIAALVLLKRDKKQTRYQRYVAKKQKTSMKAQLNTRW